MLGFQFSGNCHVIHRQKHARNRLVHMKMKPFHRPEMFLFWSSHYLFDVKRLLIISLVHYLSSRARQDPAYRIHSIHACCNARICIQCLNRRWRGFARNSEWSMQVTTVRHDRDGHYWIWNAVLIYEQLPMRFKCSARSSRKANMNWMDGLQARGGNLQIRNEFIETALFADTLFSSVTDRQMWKMHYCSSVLWKTKCTEEVVLLGVVQVVASWQHNDWDAISFLQLENSSHIVGVVLIIWLVECVSSTRTVNRNTKSSEFIATPAVHVGKPQLDIDVVVAVLRYGEDAVAVSHSTTKVRRHCRSIATVPIRERCS